MHSIEPHSVLILRLILAVSLLLASSVVLARQNCAEKISELDVTECAHSNFKEADMELNDIYNKLGNLLQDPRSLRKAQRAWVAYRDADCQYATQKEAGSKVGFSWYYSCIEEKTKARVTDLQRYLDNALSGCSQCPPLKQVR